MKISQSILFLCFLSLSFSTAQSSEGRLTPQAYIEKFKDSAIQDMLKTGVPASITLAQGMFESDYGNSKLAVDANNHFGIKCHKEWTGKTYIQDDDEKNECFRKYNSVKESYDDHSDFLRTRDRYKFLFELEITDYKGWAYGLKKAGYATNPQYAERLIKLIEENNLNKLDIEGEKLLGKKFSNDPLVANDSKNEKKVAEHKVTAVSSNNDLPFLKVKKGDTWYKLANENNLLLWQILKYNDATQDTKLYEGEIIYLVNKHNRSDVAFHIAQSGQSLRYVSQLYGIKLKKLARRNHIKQDAELKPGEKIKLR